MIDKAGQMAANGQAGCSDSSENAAKTAATGPSGTVAAVQAEHAMIDSWQRNIRFRQGYGVIRSKQAGTS
jgi:hypothetical protein